MSEQPHLPGVSQRGDTLGTLFAHFLARNYQPGDRAFVAAAILVSMVPQRVLDRPDAREKTQVPRWAIQLLRAEIEEYNPGMIDELKQIARKAGQNV